MQIVTELFSVLCTTVLSITVLFFSTRLCGKRQISQMSAFDYIVSITIGSVAAELATNLEAWYRPLLSLLVYAAGTYLVHYFSCKSIQFRTFFDGRTTTLMENGTIYKSELFRSGINLNEFLGQARVAGYFDLNELKSAQLETNGQISFLPKAENRPATPADLSLPVEACSPWIELILDGLVQQQNLRRCGKEQAWLKQQLSRQGIGQTSEVFYAACDSDGNFFACRGQ